jgi:peptidyl-prolyl cis-trans isomerase SurA
MTRILPTVTLVLAFLLLQFCPTLAQDQKVLVTVNDKPITSYDVDARVNLWKLLGGNSKLSRKTALNDIIDDIAKVEEAKRIRAEATDKDIDERLARVAKGLNTDAAGLKAKLKKQGISMAAMRQFLEGQIAFGRLLSSKYKEKVEVTDAEIDAKMGEIKASVNGQLAKIKADPRMQPITVMEIMEISFPVDNADVLTARAAEAAQYSSRFKGCKSAKAAASGIFNVQIGKKIEADSKRVPAQLKAEFNKVGPGKVIGPFRTAKGLQLWAYCGSRKISPTMPKAKLPSRDQVKSSLVNEKYDAVNAKYGKLFRKNLLIEYRDPEYAN